MTAELKTWYRELADSHPAKAHKHYNNVDSVGIFFQPTFLQYQVHRALGT